MRIIAASLACAGVCPRPAAAGERRLIDEVVAVVESQTITLSELTAETRLRLIEQEHGAADAEAVPDRALLAASLRRVIEERIVLAEVDRLKLFDLDRTEVDAALARLRGKFSSQERWEAFTHSLQLTDEEIAAVLAREIRVARYLDNRLKLAAQVRESELDEALRVQGAEAGHSAREELRQKLSREKYDRLLGELLGDLRRRADVRVLDSLGSATAASP